MRRNGMGTATPSRSAAATSPYGTPDPTRDRAHTTATDRGERHDHAWAANDPSRATTVRGRTVEIIGPAGAGKSTLTSALLACHTYSTVGVGLWNLPRRQLLATALELTPRAARAALASRGFHHSELAQMLRIGALRRVVERTRRCGADLIVMDEGPVFGLTWLDVFFSRNGDREAAAWRQRVVETWAAHLDAIVWVDAADETIMHRIRTREKPHPVKQSTDREILGFTARFRVAFEGVVHDLARARRLQIMKIRTDEVAPDAMAVRLHAALNGSPRGR